MSIDINSGNRVRDIPPLPDVVNEVIASLSDENANIDLLSSKILMDPALATRVLKIANSPFYGLSGKVSSLKEACIVLGSYSIKNIAIAAGIVNKFSKSGNAINTMKLWEHAVGTGAAARVLAERLGLDHEIAFTAGLLHDIGKILLDINYPAEYKKVAEYRAEHDCYIGEAEKNVLGVTHSEIGGNAASQWGLPKIIVNAISNHHQPGEDEDALMTSVIHMADSLCRALDIGYAGDNLIPCIDKRVINKKLLNFTEIGDLLPVIDDLSRASIRLILTN